MIRLRHTTFFSKWLYSCLVSLVILLILYSLWYVSPEDSVNKFLLRLKNQETQRLALFQFDNFVKATNNFLEFKDSDVLCLTAGSNINLSSPKGCVCKTEWAGKRCAIPQGLINVDWMQNTAMSDNLILRKNPRRLLFISLFISSPALIEIIYEEIQDLVDVFIIGDIFLPTSVNITFIQRIEKGFLKGHLHKLVYIPIPKNFNNDLYRCLDYTIKKGLNVISSINPDDIIFISHGDELIKRENLIFLKTFNNYPMPVYCSYQTYLYGFFWKYENSVSDVCAITVNNFYVAYDNSYLNLRNKTVAPSIIKFFLQQNILMLDWEMPFAGCKCIFCYAVEDIYFQLLSTPISNRPKWFSESRNEMIPFIQRLIKFGQNFDMINLIKENLNELICLPTLLFLKKNIYLIENPYLNVSLSKMLVSGL